MVVRSRQALGGLPPGRACLRFFRRANFNSARPNHQPLDIGVCLPKSIAMTEPLESHMSGSQHNIPRTNPTPNSSGIPHVATKIREEPVFPHTSWAIPSQFRSYLIPIFRNISMISNTAGPRITINRLGKIQKTVGNKILTAALAACSSAFIIRFSLSPSA